MADKLDYKKEYRDLYMPGTKPAIIEVPQMRFIQVRGQGDPNTSPAYQEAMEILYGLSFTIKMSKMSGQQPEGYFEYVVPPLEGLWWMEDQSADAAVDIKYIVPDFTHKEWFHWISMIRQPEFVTPEVFEWAKETLKKKKPRLPLKKAELVDFAEGVCCQVMHKGPYDDEPATVARMQAFVEEAGCEEDFESGRFHHEIYLSDPRRTAPKKLKTVLRHPVRRKNG